MSQARPSTPADMKRILLIEDEELLRRITEKILFSEGYTVESTINGVLALKRLEAGLKVDLIICDIRTPLMNGLEFYKRMKAFNQDIPIIILSGAIDIDMIAKLNDLGIRDYFCKPCKADILLARIRQILSSQNSSIAA